MASFHDALIREEPSSSPLLRTNLKKGQQMTAHVVDRARQSSAVAKYGIDTLSSLAPLAAPVVARVAEFGDPLLTAVDDRIARTLTGVHAFSTSSRAQVAHLRELKEKLLESQWFAKVDTLWHRSRSHAQAFYDISVQQFLALLRSPAATTGSDSDAATNSPSPVGFTSSDFVRSLSERLGRVWDEALTVPAHAFYDSVLARYNALRKSRTDTKSGDETFHADRVALFAGVQAQLGSVWEHQIVAILKNSKLVLPTYPSSQALYETAVQYYTSLGQRAHNLTQADFVEGMRNALGSSWNQNLEQPLREFLDRAKVIATKSRQDLKDNGRSVATLLTDVVSGTWQGLLHYSQSTFDRFVPEPAAPTDTATDASPAPAPAGTCSAEVSCASSTSSSSSSSASSTDKKMEAKMETAEADQKSLSLSSLSSHVTKRLRAKSSAGMGRLRTLSSTSLKNILRVDVIAYAEATIERSRTGLVHTREEVSQRLNATLLVASTNAAQLRASVAVAVAGLKSDGASSTLWSGLETARTKLTPYGESLKLRLDAAVQRARQLAKAGRRPDLHAITSSPQWAVLKKLPNDIASLIGQVPAMLGSLHAFYVKGKGDRKEYLNMVAKVREMVVAIAEAFYWTKVTPVDNAPSEQTADHKGMETTEQQSEQLHDTDNGADDDDDTVEDGAYEQKEMEHDDMPAEEGEEEKGDAEEEQGEEQEEVQEEEQEVVEGSAEADADPEPQTEVSKESEAEGKEMDEPEEAVPAAPQPSGANDDDDEEVDMAMAKKKRSQNRRGKKGSKGRQNH